MQPEVLVGDDVATGRLVRILAGSRALITPDAYRLPRGPTTHAQTEKFHRFRGRVIWIRSAIVVSSSGDDPGIFNRHTSGYAGSERYAFPSEDEWRPSLIANPSRGSP